MKIALRKELIVRPEPMKKPGPVLEVLPDGTVTLTLTCEGITLTAHLSPEEADGTGVGLIRGATVGREIANQMKLQTRIAGIPT